MREHLYKTVGELEVSIQAAETEFHRAYWDSQVDSSPANDHRREKLELEVRRLKGDRVSYMSVKDALEEHVHDPVLLRQLQVLGLSLTANQMDDDIREQLVTLSSSVESEFASFRPEIDGKRFTENDIEEVLKDSEDTEERRRVWMASKEIGALVAPSVRELARLRNHAAHELGFGDYYRMSLELQEIPEGWLFDQLDAIAESTDDVFRSWKSGLDRALTERFGVSELYPWHYADPFFQSLPRDGSLDLDPMLESLSAEKLTKTTFGRWGFDVDQIIEASDLYPRDNKCQHAFCLDVDRTAKDVRILSNIVPGQRWIEVLLHEMGHAVYDVSIDPGLPYLLRRAAHTFVTEAIALLCGSMPKEPQWLREIAGVEGFDTEEMGARLVQAGAANSLLFARWVLVVSHFERNLYSDPEADLDSLWWDLVERYQLVDRPPGREEPDWAAKIHIACAPVYYHNYLLGDVLAAELKELMTAELGGWIGEPKAGPWLTERIFRQGSLLRWDALVETATGRPLDSTAFAKQVAQAV